MLQGRAAIITGSSQGIGAGLAKYFAKQGAMVVVNYPFESEAEKAKMVVAEITDAGGKAIAIKANVADEFEVIQMMDETVKAFGQLDILINNAGITKDSSFKKMTVENFKLVMDTNLVGTFITCKAAAEIMAEQGYGRIVNMSSIAGLQGNFGQANYAASKAGVIGLTKTAAIEYAKKGVTVNAIAPGFVRTPMTDQIPEEVRNNMIQSIPVKRMGEPEDIAATAAFLASKEAGYITGQVLSVNGGWYM
ncbi:3-oxoacyl-ACP reductase FabG [Niallia endozanthoxylica]|uniref:3-oxoacyl-ACP reductase FabG n=1 Tax=Niallia endozanthoxylica TaxID=2036016 RepID=A0A5J5I485_9BACI|nr:3-oxoacyl-ACP reductase FabG [Niallia endozanthoxylica]KAA9028464.1 3-oxoacyl-ACP reductase FabG [Niallia endozanthoxylica]